MTGIWKSLHRNYGYFLFVILIAVSFLFSGDPNKKNPYPLCDIHYFEITKSVGFPVNCDAFGFIGAAINPGYLLTENYNRQSRPLYILSGTAAGYLVYGISYPFHEKISSLAGNRFPVSAEQAGSNVAVLYFCFYIGFILINFLVAFAIVILFHKILELITGEWKHLTLLKYALLLLLFSNQITQWFLWTAHTQMFTLLAPLLCLYISLLFSLKKLSPKQIVMCCILGGVLLLFYGNFLLLLPCLAFSSFYRKDGYSLGKKSFNAFVLFPVLFFLPLLLWNVILWMKGLTLFSDELQGYRQFIWVLDAAEGGIKKLFSSIGKNISTFFKTTAGILFSLILLLAVLLKYNRNSIPANGANRVLLSTFNSHILLLTVAGILFYTFLGYYADRLTAFFLPLITLVIAIRLNCVQLPKKTQYILTLIIVLWHFYIIIFGVPYFYKTIYH